MTEQPLSIPLLIAPSHTAPSDPLPIRPTHITQWTTPSSAGPSRHIALCDDHNSIWIHTSPRITLPSPSIIPPPPSQPLPKITKTTSSTPSRRPSTPRARDRGGSFASSIITTTSGRNRQISAFSPPSSARRLPSAVVTSTTATASGPDLHTHSTSSVDLRDQLREQGKDNTEGGNGGIGLGIAGLGRRLNVQGKEEERDRDGGAVSPRSTSSFDSSRTASNRWNWFRADGDGDEKAQQELREKMEEVEVEREMERESREVQKEKEERRTVERAGTPTIRKGSEDQHHTALSSGVKLKRVILPRWTEGKVVCMKVFGEIGFLGVLRDTGLLQLLSLDTHNVVSSVNLEEPEARNGESSKHRLSPFWSWRGLHLAKSDQSSVLIADAVPWPCAMPSPNGEVTRVVMLNNDSGKWEISARLELPGQGHVGVCKANDTYHLLHFLPFSLTSYPINFPSTRNASPGPSRTQTPAPRSISSVLPSPLFRAGTPTHAPDHNLKRNRSFASLAEEKEKDKEKEKGFAKFLARRNAPQPTEASHLESKIGIGEGKEVERDGYGDWNLIKVNENGEGVGVGDDVVDVFECDGTRLSVKGSITLNTKKPILDVQTSIHWQALCVVSEDKLLVYRAVPKTEGVVRFDAAFTQADVHSAFLSHVDLLVASNTMVSSFDYTDPEHQDDILEVTVPSQGSGLVAIHPCGAEKILSADHAGNVRRQTLDSVLAGISPAEVGANIDRLDSPICVFKTIRRNHGNLLVAGDGDGVIRIWTSEPFELQGSWTVFADPVHEVVLLDMPQAGVLRDSVLCTSREGTIALIGFEAMDQLFLIPASRAPLRRLFIDGKDILLAYANGKARVWNVQTCEFRRSTGLDAAEDMISSGDWVEIHLSNANATPHVLSSPASFVPAGSDLSRLITLDLRGVGRWVHSARSEHPTPLAFLRTLLSLLITFGVNEMIDEFCVEKLGIVKPRVPISMGQTSFDGLTFWGSNGPDAWRISPEMTGMRQLAIVSLLRPFLDAPDSEQYAAEVMSFFTESLPGACEPSLDFFAGYYMDSSGDVHQAARMLFKARLERMSEEQIEAVVSTAQAHLPSLQTGSAQRSNASVNALTLIGGIALDRYQSINPTALKATADSIMLYLSDSSSPHLPLAIELASRGLPTWQTYIDPMDLLRLLFHVSTHTPPPVATSAQARLAVLHIATINPPLFMSTLSMDILDAKTIEGRTSIMKLCVFMARKKPGVIQNHLPRIAEAVVKSLDPNVGKMRDDVQEAATVILNELVLAFSTIDFHSGTQRLAVGTHEGAVIMYDLKSASRLYVLEPHTSAVSSVTFAPDGRRLVTVSLEGGDVTVWKVGSSLSGFFNVGGPPRQGGDKGQPFKRIVFMRADDRPLAETSALSDVRIEWLAARKVRVSIGETALTFET